MLSLYVNFCKHGKVGIVLSASKLKNLFVGRRFLAPKLVTRKSQHVETTTVIVILKRDQVTIVLISEATLTCNIHHQGDL